MLFNSYSFLFVFFPVVFLLFFLLARISKTSAIISLVFASLVFYGYWSYKALPILVGSILINYLIGLALTKKRKQSNIHNLALIAGLVFNIGLLCFFKYGDFFIENANAILSGVGIANLSYLNIALPIGISFFTFTQIAFLVDCRQGKATEPRLSHYFLFVTYFPHLIAGPVLHHAQMMPQFADNRIFTFNWDKISVGVLVFVIGLSKKLLLADPLSEYADAFFDGIGANSEPLLFASWVGVLAYTFQIYFDFSGYTDMAIGISLCFGILLPINFNSPYKATSVIEFWRRWHISLSNFLRDYLYIPLGGNRRGDFRRYANLLTTMLIGGLWHGASWTFVFWGGLHGLFLIINQIWRYLEISGKILKLNNLIISKIYDLLCWAIVFVCVCFSWVFFRAENLSDVSLVCKGLMGLNGVGWPLMIARFLPEGISTGRLTEGDSGSMCLFWICLAFIVAVFGKNINSLLEMQKEESGTLKELSWLFAIPTGVLFVFCLLSIGKHSPFLYFQF